MYKLKAETYLDNTNRCYKKVISISPAPKEAVLQKITKVTKRNRLSPFKEPSVYCYDSCNKTCINVITNPENPSTILCIEDISLLFDYLLSNGYKINTDVTKVIFKAKVGAQNLICFISKN